MVYRVKMRYQHYRSLPLDKDIAVLADPRLALIHGPEPGKKFHLRRFQKIF
jgi:hypothetical protein